MTKMDLETGRVDGGLGTRFVKETEGIQEGVQGAGHQRRMPGHLGQHARGPGGSPPRSAFSPPCRVASKDIHLGNCLSGSTFSSSSGRSTTIPTASPSPANESMAYMDLCDPAPAPAPVEFNSSHPGHCTKTGAET